MTLGTDGKQSKRENLYRIHQKFLRFQLYLTPKYIGICAILTMFALVFIVPTLCYTVAMFDRHYFGIFHEPEPVLAKTTANKKYYTKMNIPFKTSDDINRDHEMVRYNKSIGLPAHYELEHK